MTAFRWPVRFRKIRFDRRRIPRIEVTAILDLADSIELSDIHSIRQQLHPQLKRLWEYPPLSQKKEEWLNDAWQGDYARIITVGAKRYAPLVGADLAAEVDIVFLRQQAKGQLIGEGGDIDNRLKTLFDALRMPSKGEV